jgi:hypothetical protein
MITFKIHKISFKMSFVATCFSLTRPSSGNYQLEEITTLQGLTRQYYHAVSARCRIWECILILPSSQGCTIAQAVSRRLPTAAAWVQTRVWSCGILRWTKVALGRFSPRRTSVSPAYLHSICFSTIIFTITRGWHNRPGVAAVPIASQTK